MESINIVFSVTALVIAVMAIALPLMDQKDREFALKAAAALERAYGSLTNNGQTVDPPDSSRINWLTCARQIQNSKELGSKILFPWNFKLYLQEVEHWRHQFYLCLESKHLASPDYYNSGRTWDPENAVAPDSAVIVFEFSRWSNQIPDPIDYANVVVLARGIANSKNGRALREYIKRFRKYR
jgi:hypothetical protein